VLIFNNFKFYTTSSSRNGHKAVTHCQQQFKPCSLYNKRYSMIANTQLSLSTPFHVNSFSLLLL